MMLLLAPITLLLYWLAARRKPETIAQFAWPTDQQFTDELVHELNAWWDAMYGGNATVAQRQ